jgi:pyrroline-5-carboxylate reductase
VTVLSEKIGFIGAGNMAEAFAGALVRSGILKTEMIAASDISRERLALLNHKFGITPIHENKDLFDACGIIVLAVKPQQVQPVLSEISGRADYRVTSRKLIISIAAGIPIRSIESLLYPPLDAKGRNNLPIVRVMPNTPALVLSGMSGMSCNKQCTPQDVDTTRTLLAAMGKVIEFKEQDLDAVTALSGSGPAYVYYFIEAMIEAGVELGICLREATQLTVETFKGALKLLENSGETPEALRRKVTSPGGTTETALSVFEKKEIRKNLIQGIRQAAARSRELSGA